MQEAIKIRTRELSFAYNGFPVLERISVAFEEAKISAITGPSGTGKSTLLSIFNRLWEEVAGACLQGQVEIRQADGFVDIYADAFSRSALRRKVGMVFQSPNPLPMSIARNVAFPLRLTGALNKEQMAQQVERALQQVHLWDEVKDRLKEDARSLSGGQQQRLCLARALILEPEVLLLDEPTSSLDARACAGIEELLLSLKGQCTLLMVSHYQDQVRRVADAVFELRDRQLFPVA